MGFLWDASASPSAARCIRWVAVLSSSVLVELFSSVLVELGPVSSMSPASALVDRTQFHTGPSLDRTHPGSCEIGQVKCVGSRVGSAAQKLEKRDKRQAYLLFGVVLG